MRNEKASPLTNTPDPKECPWDIKRLRIIASSPEEERAVLDMLLRQGEEALILMEKSQGDDPPAQWRMAAHKLRGTAANLGMQQLAGYCKEDEKSISSYEARTLLMEGIRQELARIRRHKEDILL